MSYSHSSVGHALVQLKSREGSRMSAAPSPFPKLLADNQFDLLAYGISYRTTVCKYVFNRNTREHELWVSPQYFSQSTNRHISHFRAGFITKHASDNVFTTRATSDLSARSNPSYAKDILNVVNATLPDIDQPRLREATRRGTIAHCIHRLDLATRNMTKGVPLDHIDADTLYDLQGTSHFLEMLLDTPDIDEVRAAVKAHLALNNPKNI